MTLQPIEALIVDLFGVVVAFDESRVYRRLADHCADPASAFAALQGLVSMPELICGRMDLEALRVRLATDHGLALDAAAFEAAWRAPYTEPMPGMAALLTALRAAPRSGLAPRCTLVLLSNVDGHHWPTLLPRHPELALFDAQCLSWRMGCAKPEAAAFDQAIGAAQVAVERCFFIDDKLENINAASRLGLRGCRFENTERLREVLRAEGVL